MSNIKNIIKNLPKQAGIYQFLNNTWKIIYIWKSVNLKSRVNSYFNWKSKLNFAKQKMVEQIKDIKYIIVENETESLILETNLIKKYLPKYNILMKDWKNHIYIKITEEEYPKIIKIRNRNKNWEYFWPYVSSNDVENILKILKKVFWYWVWKFNFFKDKNNYNLDEYLFNGKIQINDEKQIKNIYFEKLGKIRNFLKWNDKQILEDLYKQMMWFAKNMEFERAEQLKKQIESIKILNEKQIIREWIIWDYNIVNYIDKFNSIYIWLIKIRNSKIIWFFPYEIENNSSENIENILLKFVENLYLKDLIQNINTKKPILIINKEIKLKEEIFKKLQIQVAKKWIKLDLLKMCYKNIYEYAYKNHLNSLSVKNFTKQNMKNILDLLWFNQLNHNIIFECNDISHFSWNFTVASRSIIENGKINPSKYKKFKIKDLKQQEINDFDSMREIAQRRVIELKKLNNYPDLIIIDWWKPQLSSVYEIFKNAELYNQEKQKIQLVWIAKKEEILYTIKNWTFKEFILAKDSLELRLIQKIRDEAHRFAITFNRNSRNKANKKNILESLPWIWPKTRKKILKNFWSIDNLKKQDKNKLIKVLNKNIIEILENHWLI